MNRGSPVGPLLGILLVTAIGCGGGSDSQVQSAPKIARAPVAESPFKPRELEAMIDNFVSKLSDATPQKFNMSVIFKTTDDSTSQAYWEPVRSGANRGMGELELGGQVEIPIVATGADQKVADQAQSDLVNQRVVEGYKGIALAPIHDTLLDTINAAAASVPVVTVDTDMPASNRQLFIGTDGAAAGRTAGSTLANLLPKTPGTVYILGTIDSNWTDGYARTMGAQEVLQQAGFTTVARSVGWGPSTTKKDFDELTVQIPAADPPAVGCIGMFSNAYRCSDIVKQLNYAPGQIKVVAFDFDPTTLQAMKDGYIQATHAQRQYYMGYLAPYAIYSINTLGLEKTLPLFGKFAIEGNRVDTGVDVVMADQLDAFNAFLDSLGISG